MLVALCLHSVWVLAGPGSAKYWALNPIRAAESSPETAGVGSLIPSLATVQVNEL
jgi:hypothetical protein